MKDKLFTYQDLMNLVFICFDELCPDSAGEATELATDLIKANTVKTACWETYNKKPHKLYTRDEVLKVAYWCFKYLFVDKEDIKGRAEEMMDKIDEINGT